MRLEFVSSLQSVDPHAWDHLWPGYPFTRHAFLLALELSGATSAETGWLPKHCLAWEGDRLVGAIPLYLKSHSYGEYVFDWGWAQAYERAGGHYYPKLLSAIPFTPATGPRWAVSTELSSERQTDIYAAFWRMLKQQLDTEGLSGFHCLFPQGVQVFPEEAPLLTRLDCQYHWLNQGYDSFATYLAHFASRKRKNLIRERNRVAEQGLRVEMTEGAALAAEDWRHFYQLYRRTYWKRSGHDGYLNEAFFLRIGAAMPDQILMARGFLDKEWVAAALYFKDDDTLYGRYWGCIEEFDALHFECCYYQGIEYAIAKGLQRFDPGAQGEHKIARGFTPLLTRSLHYLTDPQFTQAVARFLMREREQVDEYCLEARQQLPFRSDFMPVGPDWLLKSGN